LGKKKGGGETGRREAFSDFPTSPLHTKLYSPIMVETKNTTIFNRDIKYDS